jgi:hypothetical protein
VPAPRRSVSPFLVQRVDARPQTSKKNLAIKQRLQQLFFPEGIAFDGNRFSRTAVTAPLFKYLATGEQAEERLASPAGFEPALPA